MTDQLLDALLAMVELAVIFSLAWKGMLPLPLCLLFTLLVAIPLFDIMRGSFRDIIRDLFGL